MGRLMLLEYRNDQKYTVKMMSFLGHDWFFCDIIFYEPVVLNTYSLNYRYKIDLQTFYSTIFRNMLC
jgi:hypothetical protein